MNSEAPLTTNGKNAQLLTRYKCRICEKFKDRSCYSNKELNTYTYRRTPGTSANGITAKLRCRQCTGSQPYELMCEGPCGAWQSLSQFSKSSRAAGGSKWCTMCTLWKEAAEPGVATEPPPNGQLPPEDDDEWDTQASVVQTDDENEAFSDPEAGHSDDDFDNFAYTGSHSISAPSVVHGASKFTGNRIQYQPVPYQQMSALSLSGTNLNTQPTSAIDENRTITPSATDARSQSSISNPYDRSEKSGSVTYPGWSTFPSRPQEPLAFTGYDNQGRAHIQHRHPSRSGESVFGTASQPSSSVASSIPVSGTLLNTTRSPWPKPVGNRDTGPRYPGNQRQRVDSDSEEDLM